MMIMSVLLTVATVMVAAEAAPAETASMAAPARRCLRRIVSVPSRTLSRRACAQPPGR